MTTSRTETQAVSLPQLPSALRGLWKVCAATEPDTNVMRSLAINLIAVTTADREAEQCALLDRLVQRLPCRAFIVVIDEAATDVEARVEGAMRQQRSAREIVLEQIELRTPPQALPQILGIVRPLLVNDLTSHCYWARDWFADTDAFDSFAELCDHVVVDSAGFTAPRPAIEQLQQRRDQGSRITDLTWLRVRPWRRALAEAFERFTWQPAVPLVATILHGDSAGSIAGAVSLARWLERKVQAQVYLEASAAATERCPETVALHHGDVELQVACDPRGDLVVHVTTADSCYLPFTVPQSRGRNSDLLAAAIDLF